MSDSVIGSNRQDVVAGFAERLSDEEAAIFALLYHQLLRFPAGQVTVKPPGAAQRDKLPGQTEGQTPSQTLGQRGHTPGQTVRQRGQTARSNG